MMLKRKIVNWMACLAAAALLALVSLPGCDRLRTDLPKPPDPVEIVPFDTETLNLFYQLSPVQTQSLLKNNRDTIIVDLRAPEDFAAARIAGAINIPWPSDTFETEAMKLNPGANILIYGYLGLYAINDKVAMDAVKIMRDANYRRIYWLSDGYPAWIDADLPVVDSEGNIVDSPPQGPMPEEVADPTVPGDPAAEKS